MPVDEAVEDTLGVRFRLTRPRSGDLRRTRRAVLRGGTAFSRSAWVDVMGAGLDPGVIVRG